MLRILLFYSIYCIISFIYCILLSIYCFVYILFYLYIIALIGQLPISLFKHSLTYDVVAFPRCNIVSYSSSALCYVMLCYPSLSLGLFQAHKAEQLA